MVGIRSFGDQELGHTRPSILRRDDEKRIAILVGLVDVEGLALDALQSIVTVSGQQRRKRSQLLATLER